MKNEKYIYKALVLNEDYNYDSSILYNRKKIPLTEANLNRIIKGHDNSGYAIISACRQTLTDNNGNEIPQGSQRHTDENNIRTKELRRKLYFKGYSFIPVFGGYQEEGHDKPTMEKSFIVYPFDRYHKTQIDDFNEFVNDIFDLGKEYEQDAVLIKYPNKNPAYYECDTRKKAPWSDDFKGVALNDVTKEYFTALKKWNNDFDKDKPQRRTFEGFYLNECATSIPDHRIRSGNGELVAFYK